MPADHDRRVRRALDQFEAMTVPDREPEPPVAWVCKRPEDLTDAERRRMLFPDPVPSTDATRRPGVWPILLALGGWALFFLMVWAVIGVVGCAVAAWPAS